MPLTMLRDAHLSKDGKYRYSLTRRWSPGVLLPFVMLNPSTADARLDDPTIRRCMNYAQRETYPGIIVVNLFAYRATSPKTLHAAWIREQIETSLNWRVLQTVSHAASANKVPIVCAWGSNARFYPQIEAHALSLLQGDKVCLGKTDSGYPRHPLYLTTVQTFEPYP